MFFVEPGTAMNLAEALFERRGKIRQSVVRAFNHIKRGHIGIMTFGTGGTGKTTLGHLFTQGFTNQNKVPTYDRSINIEEFKMPGDLVCTMYTAPGQERHQEEENASEGSNWSKLYQRIARSKSVGIINVVSFGYHSIRTLDYTETNIYKEGMSQEEFLQLHLEKRKLKEVEALSEIVPHVSAAPGKVWMMTVVTKQDLWWNERIDVERFYRQGAYHKEIEKIKSRLGAANFQHEFVSVSLVMDNFTTGNKRLLKPNTAGYDDNLRLLNQANLARVMGSLIKG